MNVKILPVATMQTALTQRDPSNATVTPSMMEMEQHVPVKIAMSHEVYTSLLHCV